MHISGQCHCGEIEFEGELDPDKVGICHCSDCQALSGSAFRTVGLVDAGNFTVTRGQPSEYIKVGASGNRRIQAFCGTCGSALYATNADGEPLAYSVRLGTVSQRHELPPQFEIWRQSALPWLPEHEQAKQFDRNPA